jgi:hypothetical protein
MQFRTGIAGIATKSTHLQKLINVVYLKCEPHYFHPWRHLLPERYNRGMNQKQNERKIPKKETAYAEVMRKYQIFPKKELK